MNPRKHCTPVWWVSEELDKLREFHSLMEDMLVQRQEKKAQTLRTMDGVVVDNTVIEWLTSKRPEQADANDLPKFSA